MSAAYRLLAIGHSYAVNANRRLAHEIAVQSHGRWDVTVVAPRTFRGDLGPIRATASRDEPVDVRLLDVHFDRSPHLMWYGDLRRVLHNGWDAVHCWEEPYVLAGAQIARNTPAGSRLVIASFQNIAKRYPWPFSAFEHTTMARADGWIAFGETVRGALGTRVGYAGKPCRVVPPGVDTARFCPDPAARARSLDRLGWSATDPVVGFLGRFVPEKGIQVLLDALAATRTRWRALFVGGGPLEGAIRAAKDRFSDRVQIITSASHDEVPAWLNAMTVLCAPSQTTTAWREQFGRMLIEAMACGVPVMASRSGEIPFVVADAGVLLPEDDAQAWAASLDSLLGDESTRMEMRQRGLARARERYAWPVIGREHVSFLESVLDTAGVKS